MLWRDVDESVAFKTFGYLVMGFGDRPAAAILHVALDLVGDLGANIDARASHAIRNEMYADDGLTGGSRAEVERMMGDAITAEDESTLYTGTIAQVLGMAKMKPKMMVASGAEQQDNITLIGTAVMGIT